MAIVGRESRETRSGLGPTYERSFLHRVHQILKMGYERLDCLAYARSMEEEITGGLTRAIQEALEDSGAPRWAKHFWAIEEEPVQNNRGRSGKRRLRVDIIIMRHQHGHRPRFIFEAKRLSGKETVKQYLGRDGLGCFLDGRYAKEERQAGMLGYVQRGSTESCSADLKEALLGSPESNQVAEGLLENPIVEGLATYRSVHWRLDELPPITLFHTFLSFC